MSDYSLQVTWSTKDALATNSQLKAVSATELGNEFSAIAAAIATKYDSDDLASEAEALTSNAKLITPLNLDQVFKDNDGILSDLQAITGSAADGLLAWDQGTTTAKLFTLGDGLEFSGDTIRLEHLGIGDLEDPGADRIMFWDDSAGAMAWLTPSSDFSISATTISLASTISAQTITTLTATTVELGGGASITGVGTGQIEVDTQAVFSHDSSNTYSSTSAQIFQSTSAPTTEGSNGDIYFEYTA